MSTNRFGGVEVLGTLMYCTGCGSAIVGGARFCVNCGTAVVTPVAARPAQAPVAAPPAPVQAPAAPVAEQPWDFGTQILPMSAEVSPDTVGQGPAYDAGTDTARNAGIAIVLLALVVGAFAGGVAYGRHSGHAKRSSALATASARQQRLGFDAAAKSDLKGMQIAEETYLTDSAVSYTTSMSDLQAEGFSANPDDDDSVVGIDGADGYCLSAVSRSGTIWYLGSSTGGPTTTACTDN